MDFTHCRLPLKFDLHLDSLSMFTYFYYDISYVKHPYKRDVAKIKIEIFLDLNRAGHGKSLKKI